MLGSPIAHSKSPLLHAAAHRVLGLERRYERIEVPSGGLARFLAERGAGWRGLSVTMPLKPEALAAADAASELARLTGAANTLVFDGPGPDARIFADNTDVAGIVAAIGEAQLPVTTEADVLGAGATAMSALAALELLGVREVRVVARDRVRAGAALGVARELGLAASFAELEGWGGPAGDRLIVSTLPVAASAALAPSDGLVARTSLFDVVYAPWPSPLAARWLAAGRPVASGEAMLLHQALAQARQFAGAPSDAPWADEAAVLAAMRAALASAR